MSDITKDIETLLALTKEAHESIKDLRAVLREAKEYHAGIKVLMADSVDEIHKTVDDIIGETIEEGLKNYSESIIESIDTATDSVYRRFDTLADILLGETGPGDEGLAVLIRGWMKNRRPKDDGPTTLSLR